MKWLELSVEAPSEYVEPLSELFRRYGGGVAVEEPGGHYVDEGETPHDADRATVTTYIPLDAGAEERRSRIDLGIRLVAHLGPISPLRERILQDEEWQNAWKQHFHPLHIGEKMVVVPTWLDYEPKAREVVIELDPGMAFGTGHHPTTRMCLELLEELVRPGAGVIDLGCGSGILSIAAAKLGAGRVLGLDIDSTAVAVGRSNVGVNGVTRTTRIDQGTIPSETPPERYDIAVANISAKTITALAGGLVSVVAPGGVLIVSGLLLDSKDAVARALTDAGALVERNVKDGDWASLVASPPA